MVRQRPQYEWREQEQQPSGFAGIESGCLLHSVLNGGMVLPENAAENSAHSSSTKHARQPARVATDCAHGRLQRALAARLLRSARHATQHHRKRGLNGVLRRGRIGANLLADFLNAILAELLSNEIEERHGVKYRNG